MKIFKKLIDYLYVIERLLQFEKNIDSGSFLCDVTFIKYTWRVAGGQAFGLEKLVVQSLWRQEKRQKAEN